MNNINDYNTVCLVEKYIMEITKKYAKRENIYEPLTKTLGDYSHDIILRAIRNVMFEKIIVDRGSKTIWKIKRHTDCPEGQEYVNWLAYKIIKEYKTLKQTPIVFNTVNTVPEENTDPTSFIRDAFFDDYWDKLEYYAPEEEKRVELLHAIMAFGEYMAEGAFHAGIDFQKTQRHDNADKLIDAYNDIELALTYIKKYLDKE
jgi:hypothetical protein